MNKNERGRDAPKSVACGDQILFSEVPATSRIIFTMMPSGQWGENQYYTKLTTYGDQASLVQGAAGSWELTSMIRPAKPDDLAIIVEILEKTIGSI
ncbi:MAG: hypothetical protein HYW65_01440 [Candidatus Liptonbacteria bacterium]|nr:hypothetical protein [Candidatus Liptonbacteria bacterium]